MRTIAVATLALCLATLPASAAEKLTGPIPAKVTKIRDGDTLEVTAHIWIGVRMEVAIRIDGIDTPEVRGKCQREKDMAAQASALMNTLITKPMVTLFDIKNDMYAGRALARVVTADGTDVGKEMIRQGLARPYNGDTKQTWCATGTVSRP